jgi:alcohol dehydrogenase, propanol-preferring
MWRTCPPRCEPSRGEAGLRAAIVVAPAPSAFTMAIEAIAPGGAVIFIALPAKDRDTLPVSISTLANFEKRLIGSNVGTRADLLEAVELALTAGILSEVEPLPLAEANAALDRLRRGGVPGRLVLTA